MSPLGAHAHFESLGTVEWVLVGLAAVIGAWTIWLAVRYTLAPGEESPDHVKRSILDDRTVITVTARTALPPQHLLQASGLGAPADASRGAKVLRDAP